MEPSTFLLLVGVIYVAPHLDKRLGILASSLFILAAAAFDMGWL